MFLDKMVIHLFLFYILFIFPSGKADSEFLSIASCKTLCSCSEKDGVLFVSCEEKGVLSLSEINIPSSQYLDLNLLNNGLFKIHENELSRFSNIISLHLGFNNIADIEPGTFNSLSLLKKLHINYNSLEILRDNTFKGLENLEFLQADNNFISTIEANTFSKLTKLKVLILNDNAIEFIPNNVFRFVPLTHLDLRGNQLQTLPYVGFLEHIGRIIELQLEDNKWNCNCDLLQLKFWLENMPRQSIIGDVVCYSPIQFKGAVLRRLKNEELCESQNELENSSGPLSLVGTSSVSNDRISTKTAQIQNVPTQDPTLFIPPNSPTLLSELYCPVPCHCSSHTMSGTLIHCKERNLESLSDIGPPPQYPRKLILEGNLINILQNRDFNNYGNLEMLHLGNNHIELIEEQTFLMLSKLQKLYLNGNHLRRLKPGIFIGLKSIEYLYLEFNYIKEILPGTFSFMSKLKVLYLNNNLIQVLPDHIFSGVPLTSLNLKGNQFSTVSASNILEDLSSNLQIELQDNPWECTCNLMGLKTWIQEQKNIMVSDILCRNPINLKDKKLKLVQKEVLCPELVNSLINPTQTNDGPLFTTTNTVDTFLKSLSDSIPLSVVILGLLIFLLTTVLCSAGIIVLVLHKKKRSKKQVNEEIRDTSPVHIKYSMYGHKTTHHTTERPGTIICEQRIANPVIQVYQNPPFSPKHDEQEGIDEFADVDSKQTQRSILEKENDSPLTGSNVKFRASGPSEFLPFQDASYLYRNIIEKESEIKQLGIADYLRKNMAHLQPDTEIYYPRSHEDLQLMETLMYSRPRKILVGQMQNEYFELKANLQAEPDYLEVLEQRT